MAICENFLERALVMKHKSLLISPQPGANELQGGSSDGLICVLLCENMADGGLTSTQGNLEGVKNFGDATLASGAEANQSLLCSRSNYPSIP